MNHSGEKDTQGLKTCRKIMRIQLPAAVAETHIDIVKIKLATRVEISNRYREFCVVLKPWQFLRNFILQAFPVPPFCELFPVPALPFLF